MPKPQKPKRVLTNLDTRTSTPPDPPLPDNHRIARIVSASGKNLFTCLLADGGGELLAELAPVFRGKTWLIRGGYVVVNTAAFAGRENKIGGEIVNVVRNEREWRKMVYWPKEFVENRKEESDSEEEESVVGKMPPSDEDE